jgi:hypothetical protein
MTIDAMVMSWCFTVNASVDRSRCSRRASRIHEAAERDQTRGRSPLCQKRSRVAPALRQKRTGRWLPGTCADPTLGDVRGRRCGWAAAGLAASATVAACLLTAPAREELEGNPAGGASGAGGSEPPGTGISCGPKSCIAGEVCCVRPGEPHEFIGCLLETAGCPMGDVAVPCDDRGDCPSGNRCCAQNAARKISIKCKSACGADDAELCRTLGDCESPTSSTCAELSGLPPGYKGCQ